MKQKIGQAAVVAGALYESPLLLQAPQIDVNCTVFDNVGNSTTNPDGLSEEKFIGTEGWVAANPTAAAGLSACNTNFAFLANQQGIGISPIATGAQSSE